ncbi:MAG: DUF5076 domain-containing protein [Pseudomonadota bacterium]
MNAFIPVLASFWLIVTAVGVYAQPAVAPVVPALVPRADSAVATSTAAQASKTVEREQRKSDKYAHKRRCRLDKPLFGASPTSVKCYALAAYKPPPLKSLDESAMLGEPKMDHDDELLEDLDVPDGVRDAEDAVEVMRAWVADGALHVIFDPETFRHDVSEWGRLLGDVAQHIANAVELDGQMSRQEALNQIHDAIDVSVNANAVTMEGKIKGRTEH